MCLLNMLTTYVDEWSYRSFFCTTIDFFLTTVDIAHFACSFPW